MAEPTEANPTERRIRRTGAAELETAQATGVGAAFAWHYGRVTRLGVFDVAGESTREVTILWEEGRITSQQGNITEQQWEIFRLAFLTTGRIAVLSDLAEDHWMYDYRFLEAVR